MILVWTRPAHALPGTGFESTDGNLIVDAQGDLDWANVGIECGPGSSTCALDKPTGATDDSLGQGAKDDHETITVITGSIPNNKSDLTRFYLHPATVGLDTVLFLSWQRANTLGTANFSFELNQLPQPDVPAAGGPWALNRRAGDVLILFDFRSGGNQVELALARWVTSGEPRQVCQANNTVPCWGKTIDLDAAGFADGAVNDGYSVVDPIDPDAPRTLESNTFGEAAINLTDSGVLDSCIGFGSAMVRSRASSAFNAELKDFIAPFDVSITPPVDVSGAQAGGSALGAKVDDQNLLGANNPVNLPDPPGTDPSVRTSQTGAGNSAANAHQLDVNVPDDGSTLHAGALHVSSLSRVASQPPGAEQTSVAETLDVNVLDGVVTADVVRGAARASANTTGASYDTVESTLENLKIDPDGSVGPSPAVARNNVAPNTTIELDSTFFGGGSFVKLYEEQGSTTAPPAGTPLGTPVTYGADVTVTMIRVHITDRDLLAPGQQTMDVVVSRAVAHASFPTVLCLAEQEVSGHAFVIQETTTTDPTAPLTVGFVSIPRTGGHGHQELDSFTSPLTILGASASDSRGGFDADDAAASSYAEAADVCVLPSATGCAVSATAVRSRANSSATASSRSSDTAGTQLLGVNVAGTGPVLNPAPNTRIDIPGVGFVVLNEQVCDGGGTPVTGSCGGSASDPASTGITVRAIHLVVLPDSGAGSSLAEVIVAEAHSDAKFVTVA